MQENIQTVDARFSLDPRPRIPRRAPFRSHPFSFPRTLVSHSILIAEDEAFIANLFKINLEREGHAVEVARNGEEAIDFLREKKPNLILLDLLMPDVDGFQVLKHLKKKGKKRGNPPVVILTNLNQPLDRKKCAELGAADYVVKSTIDVDDLTAIVKKYAK